MAQKKPLVIPIHNIISQWLADNPVGDLMIVTAFASAGGLNWLEEHAPNRKIKIIIGNRDSSLAKGSYAQRYKAVDFLKQPGISVFKWDASKKRSKDYYLHSKVWVCNNQNGKDGSVLIGSANLTRAGLDGHWETMASLSGSEERRVRDEMKLLLENCKDCVEEVVKIIIPSNHTEIKPLVVKLPTIKIGQPVKDLQEIGEEGELVETEHTFGRGRDFRSGNHNLITSTYSLRWSRTRRK